MTPSTELFSDLHPVTPVAPNVTRLVVDGSSSPTSYTRLTINPGTGKDLSASEARSRSGSWMSGEVTATRK